MSLKITALVLALGVLGFGISEGIVGASGEFSKAACFKSIERQADKELFAEMNVDKAGLCGCFAELKLNRDTATHKEMKPCLDKYLKEHIVSSCEKDETEKVASRNRQMEPGDEMTEPQLIGPAMNCECVYERSSEWVWRNFDASLHSHKMKPDDATNFANAMMNECKWK